MSSWGQASLRLLSALFLILPMLTWAGEVSLRSLFSPWDDIEGSLIGEINAARNELWVQAYLLTSRPITQALVAAHRRGVSVKMLADAEMAEKMGAAQLDVLAKAGIPIWLETRYAAAHNKVLIIDALGPRPVLATGSYNFTWSAQARNAENVLIVTGDSALAKRYADNWARHQQDAQPYERWLSGNPAALAERGRIHAE